jgi:hypothetical protein
MHDNMLVYVDCKYTHVRFREKMCLRPTFPSLPFSALAFSHNSRVTSPRSNRPMSTRRQRLTLTFVVIALCPACATPALAQSSTPVTTPTTPASAPAPDTTAPADGATITGLPGTNWKPVPVTVKPAPPTKKSTVSPGKTTDANGRVVTKQTVVVSANFTPEEKEDDELNHHMAYSFGSVTDTNCQTIIDKYQRDLIPTAEQAKFPKNRAKYLGTAHEAIARCQMSQGRYIEAEQSLRDALVQAEIWPGKDDSLYPNLWIRLSMAQLKQEHWKDAETSAAQSDALLQSRIDDHQKLLPTLTDGSAETMRKKIQHEHEWRCTTLSNLSYIDAQQGKLEQATKLIEQAYQEGVAGAARPQDLQDIEYFGAHLADLTDNSADSAKWAARADTTPQK